MKKLILTTLIIGAAVMAAMGQNGFKLEQSAIAAGGGNASNQTGGAFAVTSTVGQAVAGAASTNAPFAVESGFLYGAPSMTTAATVSASGKVTTAGGAGITKVKVTITDARGQVTTGMTSRRGAFLFNDIAAGETYIISVSARKFTFAEPTVVRTVNEHLTDIDFTANED